MQRRGRVILAVGDWKWKMTKPSGMPGMATAKLKGAENDGEMPRSSRATLLLLFRGRSSSYQIFAAPLANNASLDKPESLFTIAGYSFVAFFLGGSNVDSSSVAVLTFNSRKQPLLPFVFLSPRTGSCELLFSIAGKCYDYVQTNFLTAIACYWNIKLRWGTIGLCLWSAVRLVHTTNILLLDTPNITREQHSPVSKLNFLQETNQPFPIGDFRPSNAGDSRSHRDGT